MRKTTKIIRPRDSLKVASATFYMKNKPVWYACWRFTPIRIARSHNRLYAGGGTTWECLLPSVTRESEKVIVQSANLPLN